jgi:hypothetical protein
MISYYFYFVTLEKSGRINVISPLGRGRHGQWQISPKRFSGLVSATETPLTYLDARSTSNTVF